MKKIFLILFMIFQINIVNSQVWSSVGTGLNGYGRIESMCEYNGDLYVGGYFDSIGGVQAFSIAKWNGTTWDSVPNSYFLTNYTNPWNPNLEIFDMVVYNGELVVAGSTWVNGSQQRNIAKWNGTTWSQLGTGMDNRIFAIEVYNGELYATGHFGQAGGVLARGIARWNGTNWNQVGGPGLNLSPGFTGSALEVNNGELYLAGGFYLINGLPVQSIAKWNGTVWDSVGSIDASISFQSLGSYNNKIYAGGYMNINSNPSNNWISSWNSTTWDSVGLGLNYIPGIMAEYNNELYVAGQFDTAGGTQALCIARWNELQWNTVGSGLNLFHINVDSAITPWDTTIVEKEFIYSMYTYDNELYVGGKFTQIGGINANSIAKWHIAGVSVDELNNEVDFSLYPTPFSKVVYLYSKQNLENAQIIIHDLLGQEVRKLNKLFGQHFEIDRENLISGIYFLSLTSNGKTWTEKLMVE
ncbi:MAG: T9SS type A sorting domain-containing protein [Bacteroidetes bacterium]|nr:T9SS type A sorting domain-containing protein [Bacteroidota bacterium]MBK9046727.1 T9SS type A sorting domain-containing protein [Bacteroidota bacterium]